MIRSGKAVSFLATLCLSLTILVANTASVNAASTSVSWNFKNTEFKNLGTISSTAMVDGLTLTASSSKKMSVVADSASAEGVGYTYALNTQGSGSTSFRSVRVPVTGSDTIKVVLRSTGSDQRSLAVYDGNGKRVGTIAAPAGASVGSFVYSGGSKAVYLTSVSKAIYIYKIQVDSGKDSSGSSSASTAGTSSSSAGKSSSSGTVSGKTITVKNGGTSLAAAVKAAKAGTTIVIDGTVKSGSVSLPAGVNISGQNNATIDFSQTSGGSGRGITIAGNGSKLTDVTVTKASDNGIYVTGSGNVFRNVTCCYNQDAGFQICNGGADNSFYSCHSHHNADPKGENADGFAVKLHSGTGNYFERCVSEYNSDDGWDCYAAHGAIKCVNCQANYNGLCNGIKGDGNGFKMGGVDNKTPGKAAHLDPLQHYLSGCTAKGNYANGFDRNNQSGVVTMDNCTGDSNKGKNFAWPLTGTPSALGYKVTFGKAVINSCTSINGKNDISGATLKGSCKGF